MFPTRKGWHFLVFLAAVFGLVVVVPSALYATTCDVAALPTSGTLTANHLNSRFTQVENCVNGRLDTNNLSGSAAITTAQLANPKSYFAVSAQIEDCGSTTTGAFVTQLPVSATLKGATVKCHGCSASNIDVAINIGGGGAEKTFTGITNTTLQSDFALSSAVASSTDVSVDLTVTTAGSCASFDVVMYFTATHSS